jgi:hypothetical protein
VAGTSQALTPALPLRVLFNSSRVALMRRNCIGDGRLNGIRAFGPQLRDDITGVVDGVDAPLLRALHCEGCRTSCVPMFVRD